MTAPVPNTSVVVPSAIMTLGENVDGQRLESKLGWFNNLFQCWKKKTSRNVTCLYGGCHQKLMLLKFSKLLYRNNNELLKITRSRSNMCRWHPRSLIRQFHAFISCMARFMTIITNNISWIWSYLLQLLDPPLLPI